MSNAGFEEKWIGSMREVDRQAWNALAAGEPVPILEYEWLSCLEESGSVSPQTGWRPSHLILYLPAGEWPGPQANGRGDGGTDGGSNGRADGGSNGRADVPIDSLRDAQRSTPHRDPQELRLAAAAPLYIRDDSMGEFVFDFAWARVASEIGAPYYPKLVGMSPMTPCPAYRFLIHPDLEEQRHRITQEMLQRIEAFCRRTEIPTAQFNFTHLDFHLAAEAEGFRRWEHQGFVWRNHDYRSFDDYLATFTKNQRRNIRRERASMHKQGIVIRAFTGDAIPSGMFRSMWRFYKSTNDQFGPWAARFLTPQFFDLAAEQARDAVLFVAAYEGEEAADRAEDPTALSMLVWKDRTMLGRYWGAKGFVKDLHFNLCYYSPIEWAIEHGVDVFDPGMGSPHKLRRGFEAVENYSVHRFFDERMDYILEHNIERINAYEEQMIDQMNATRPVKSEPR